MQVGPALSIPLPTAIDPPNKHQVFCRSLLPSLCSFLSCRGRAALPNWATRCRASYDNTLPRSCIGANFVCMFASHHHLAPWISASGPTESQAITKCRWPTQVLVYRPNTVEIATAVFSAQQGRLSCHSAARDGQNPRLACATACMCVSITLCRQASLQQILQAQSCLLDSEPSNAPSSPVTAIRNAKIGSSRAVITVVTLPIANRHQRCRNHRPPA